jgi:hypothetical protein
VLKGLPPKLDLSEAFEITRRLAHGHAAAVASTAELLGLAELIDPNAARRRAGAGHAYRAGDRAGLEAGDRARPAGEDRHQLPGWRAGLSSCDEDDLYAAVDWVLTRQQSIENALSARHEANRTLVAYDVSSAALEGRHCPGAIGYTRDTVKARFRHHRCEGHPATSPRDGVNSLTGRGLVATLTIGMGSPLGAGGRSRRPADPADGTATLFDAPKQVTQCRGRTCRRHLIGPEGP